MSRQSTWRSLFLSYLSRPSGERPIYREAIRRPPRTILELGIGAALRATRLIEIASWSIPLRELEYTGIDPFESRRESDGPGMTLKKAYQALRATGAKVRLLPGTARETLSPAIGSLPPLDFVVASGEEDLAALAAAIAFYPNLLQPDTRIFSNRSRSAAPVFSRVPFAEIHRYQSDSSGVTRRAA